MSVQIIPVIDVMRGIVVHASGGKREHYQPLQSILSQSCDPFDVIEALLELHDFKKIYIADLDAINDHNYDESFYLALHDRFPDVEFWLDVGIRTYNDWQIISQISGIWCVLGSETIEEVELLQAPLVREQAILSLDYQDGEFLGTHEIIDSPKHWPKKVIVMNLDHVGAEGGPDYSLLAIVKALSIDSELIAAGGVRNERDLEELAKREVTATLVASALHRGSISTKVLSEY